MTPLPIYLDYMATTPVDPRVVNIMLQYLGPEACFGNPASVTHIYGKLAAQAVERARAQVAELIQATPQEIIFTSGATEANNLAILGAARFYQRKGRHVITLSTEHKAVLDSFYQLEQEGFHVTYLTPQPDGLLDIQMLQQAITDETILVSIMQVNNEIGVIQDIGAIGELLHHHGIIFHVDAAQSVGKLDINLRQLPVDLMAFSAHKIYGPKGVGALYIRHKPRIRIQALSFGGGQEGGMRSGTLATHQIAGMGEAFAIAKVEHQAEQARISHLHQTLWQGIKALPGIHLNGHEYKRIAGNLNISFAGIDSDALFTALSELAISSTSACIAASGQPSYVLEALGLDAQLAHSSIRVSLGRFTTLEQIQQAVQIMCNRISDLYKLNT